MQPRHLKRIRLMVPTCLGLLAAACGGSALEPGAGPGTASVTATGAVSSTGSGLAIFQSMSSNGTSLFQILLAPTSAASVTTSWQVQVVNYSGRLPVGTYQLLPLSASSTSPTASFYYTTGGSMTMYNATSGELVITASSPSAVRGTFHFTGADVGGAGTVTAEGAFNASCAPGMSCQ
jgi:hypothetical protein